MTSRPHDDRRAGRGDDPSPHPSGLVLLCLLSVYLAWGSTYLAIRIALAGFPPFLLAGLRGLVAGSLLAAFGRWRGHSPVSWRALGNAALVGVLMVAGGNGLVTWAEQSVSSGLAAAVASTGSIWLVLMLAALGEKPTGTEQAGIAIGFAGVLLLNLEGELRASPLGAAALLGATLSWAAGSVLTRRLVLPEGATFVAVELLSGGILMTGFGYAIGERLIVSALTPSSVAAWCYLVVAGSLIGFSSFTFLIRNVRPALATSFVYVNPVVAVLLGVVLAGEHLSPIGTAGVAVSVVGLLVVTMASRASR
ncbi:MAG TPA: drug/metabolite exporter YedA [Candidatus Binatia bacterium]